MTGVERTTLAWRLGRLVARGLSRAPLRRFEAALEDPARAQRDTLRRILETTGRRALPEGPVSWGEPEAFLSRQRAKFYETTSGTGGARKRVPQTPGLLASFQEMFLVWAGDVVARAPVPFRTGRVFLSVSPRPSADAGEAVQDDRDYLGGAARAALSAFCVSDPNAQAADAESFFERVGLDLANAADLEALSFWSPAYFLSLWAEILARRERWLSEGLLNGPAARAFAASEPRPHDVWPRLKLFSAWADGSSRAPWTESIALGVRAWAQPKGLLATEGPMTVPWRKAGDARVPFWTGAYLEGLDSRGRISPAAEWREGETYEILLTTFGGLARYRVGDVVRTTGRFGRSPTLEFVGRAGFVSDLVGEKLEDAGLEELWTRRRLPRGVLAPLDEGSRSRRYVFFVDAADAGDRAEIETRVETALQDWHHYALARSLRQLAQAETVIVSGLRRAAFEHFERQGRARGDVKERLLWRDPEETRRFLLSLKTPKVDRSTRTD